MNSGRLLGGPTVWLAAFLALRIDGQSTTRLPLLPADIKNLLAYFVFGGLFAGVAGGGRKVGGPRLAEIMAYAWVEAPRAI